MAANRRTSAHVGALLALSCVGLAATACGSSSPSSSSPTGSSTTASVAYAASLEFLNEKVAGPGFEKATGLSYTGTGNTSGALEAEIAAGEIKPNVFQSVGGDNITPLEPKFTKWYIQYAATSIGVAYNPASKYAPQFEAIASGKKPIKDLFPLMEEPGFKLGRTDPNVDPQGRAFIYMLQLAQARYHLPADTVTKILGGPMASSTSPQIFAESSLDATLESGQLDAASAYASQATQLHLHFIKLPPSINLGNQHLGALYGKAHITITGGVMKTGSPLVIDITTIGPSSTAADKFVAYTLSSTGLAQYKQAGYKLLKPTLTGDAAAVPASVKSELGG